MRRELRDAQGGLRARLGPLQGEHLFRGVRKGARGLLQGGHEWRQVEPSAGEVAQGALGAQGVVLVRKTVDHRGEQRGGVAAESMEVDHPIHAGVDQGVVGGARDAEGQQVGHHRPAPRWGPAGREQGGPGVAALIALR
ncbi:MAG: hypothetical protein JRI25_15055, partial [Deltaproteobacteria bacterium]|nr:hypothetical protein [Deltaproteobacteria bacterium]